MIDSSSQRSKYRDREIIIIRTFSVGLKDDFCIRIKGE